MKPDCRFRIARNRRIQNRHTEWSRCAQVRDVHWWTLWPRWRTHNLTTQPAASMAQLASRRSWKRAIIVPACWVAIFCMSLHSSESGTFEMAAMSSPMSTSPWAVLVKPCWRSIPALAVLVASITATCSLDDHNLAYQSSIPICTAASPCALLRHLALM